MALTCIMADDHPAVLDSISRLLELNDIDVLECCPNGDEALAAITSLRPQIAIADVRMPGMDGLTLARAAALAAPETAVILYTGFADLKVLAEALEIGVRGFVLKDAPLDELLRAIAMAAGGDVYVDPVLGGAFLSTEKTAAAQSLTNRERTILGLLADGLRNDEIGARLGISYETVLVHTRHAKQKLDANTTTHAVVLALRKSLIG